jgi:phosphatidylserine/phosphatidylglycerophosphate/cardiolipin synthase-like enzyme
VNIDRRSTAIISGAHDSKYSNAPPAAARSPADEADRDTAARPRGEVEERENRHRHPHSLAATAATSIGTLNLDIRSLRLHKELMVWIYDVDAARRSEEIFEADLKDCAPLTMDDVRSWNWARRFRNSAARLFSNLL